MSGKFIVAALLAMSTASAATVGVFYSRVVSPRNVEATAASTETPSPTGSVKSAVVLNAQEGSFDRLAESGDAPICPGQTAATGCVMVSSASPIRLNILGYTVSIPPVWLGGASEDQYFADGSPVSWLEDGPSLYGPSTAVGRRRPFVETDGADPTKSAQSQDQSRSRPASMALDTVVVPASPSFPFPSEDVDPGATLFLGAATSGRWGRGDWPFFPDNFFPAPIMNVPRPSQLDASRLPAPEPTPAVPFSFDETTVAGNAPEPSTWLMTIAGFVTLTVLKRRRIASALRPSTR